MRIAVIGAGISGLAFAKYASIRNISVKVFESTDQIGGIAKVKMLDNAPYHMVGGHCFNSKFEHVKEFVFENVLPEDKWNKVQRKASILFKGHKIDYPIEYSIKQIFQFDKELALNIVADYFKASKAPANNLSDWFVNNFGSTLAEEYFVPYNQKIWNIEPSEMTPDWVTDKLPLPNDAEMLRGLIYDGKDHMPHSTFYYPRTGTQNTFIESLADGLDISLNSKIKSIKQRAEGKYIINGQLFDHVIYTGPLDKIGEFVEITDEKVKCNISKLKYNKVTTVIWKSKPTNDTWTYIPGSDCLFHRLIHIGNFVNCNINYTISEAVGEVSYKNMVESGKTLEQLIEPIDYNVSDRAYVVFDKNIKRSKAVIFDYFNTTKIHLLGRFGEWEYYNMDVCIKRSMDVLDSIIKEEGKVSKAN